MSAVQTWPSRGDPCPVADCTRLVYAKGLCSAHLARQNRHGYAFPPIPIGQWPPSNVFLVCVACGTQKNANGQSRCPRCIEQTRVLVARAARPLVFLVMTRLMQDALEGTDA